MTLKMMWFQTDFHRYICTISFGFLWCILKENPATYNGQTSVRKAMGLFYTFTVNSTNKMPIFWCTWLWNVYACMHVCFCTIAAGLHPYFMTIKGFGCLHFPKSSTVICIHFAIFLCNMPQCNGSQLMGHYPKMDHQSVMFNIAI